MATPAKPALDRIDLRLYNTIVIFDVYSVGRSPEACRDSLLAAIRAGEVEPTERVAREVTMQNSIRASWLEQKPWYASDVSDGEFESLKELSCSDAWDTFYKKAK
jgi:hypothetical protein